MDTVFSAATLPAELESRILALIDGASEPEPALRALAREHADHASTILGWLEALRSALPVEPAADHFPGHRLLRELGRGGMGVVYLARDEQLGRTVALKTLPAPVDRDLIARFLREARAAAQLRHPHICPIHVVGDAKGQPFFTMEYVPGVSLRALLTRLRASGRAASQLTGDDWRRALFADPRTPALAQVWPAGHADVVARLLLPIVEALAHAHAHGVVHRDVKPGNIMLRFDGAPVLLDFGLAQVDAEGSLTRSGDMVGTPHAMAPEQLGGDDSVGPATDLWAIGVTLYELLTLALPFPGTVQEAVAGILQREPIAPRRLDPGASRALEAVALRCLEKAPSRRYPSAAALAADLRAFLELRPLAVQPLGRAARAVRWVRRRPAAAAAASFAVLAVVGIPTTVAIVESMRRRDVEAEQGRTRARAAELSFTVGRLAAARGAWEDALSAYDAAQRGGYADGFELDLRRLDALRGLGELSEFADVLARALAAATSDAQRARLWLQEGDLLVDRSAGSAAGLDQVLRARRTELLPPADAAYADALLATDVPAAIEHLDRALAIDPAHRSALGLVCTSLAARYEWDRLREALARFAAHYPDDPTAQVLRYLGTQLSGTGVEQLMRDLEDSPMRGPIRSIHRALTELRRSAAGVRWGFVIADDSLGNVAKEFLRRAVQVSTAITALRARGFALPLHPAIAGGVPTTTKFLGAVLTAGPGNLRQAITSMGGELIESLPERFPDRAAFIARGWARFARGDVDRGIADFAAARARPSLVDVAFGTRTPLDRVGTGIQLMLAAQRLHDGTAGARTEVATWFHGTVARALAQPELTAADLGQLATFAGIASDAGPLLDILPHWLRIHRDRVERALLDAHLHTLAPFVPHLLAEQTLATPEELPLLVDRLERACRQAR